MTTGWARRVAIPASTEPPTRTGLSVTAHTHATMVWAATLSARAMVCVTPMALGSATVTPWSAGTAPTVKSQVSHPTVD